MVVAFVILVLIVTVGLVIWVDKKTPVNKPNTKCNHNYIDINDKKIMIVISDKYTGVSRYPYYGYWIKETICTKCNKQSIRKIDEKNYMI